MTDPRPPCTGSIPCPRHGFDRGAALDYRQPIARDHIRTHSTGLPVPGAAVPDPVAHQPDRNRTPSRLDELHGQAWRTKHDGEPHP